MDFKVTVKYGIVALGGAMTPAAVRDAIAGLDGSDRLSFDSLKDVPTSLDVLSLPEIVTGLEALTSTDRLSATALKELSKTIVTGAEKALNEIGEGNVYSAGFQTLHPSANILPGDFFVAKDIPGYTGTSIEDSDWVIALTSNPGFTFTDATKWRIIKVSKIPTKLLSLQRYSESTSGSGIQPFDYGNYKAFAKGLYSSVFGRNCQAISESSTAGGSGSAATKIGANSFASGRFTASGDAQVQKVIMRLQTSNTTPTEMVLPDPYIITPGKSYDLKVRLLARMDLGTRCKSWEWKALVSYTGAAANYSVGTPVIQSVGTGAWTASLTFSDTLPQRMIITCTGLAAVVRWVAYIEAVEVFSEDGLGTIIASTESGITTNYVL